LTITVTLYKFSFFYNIIYLRREKYNIYVYIHTYLSLVAYECEKYNTHTHTHTRYTYITCFILSIRYLIYLYFLSSLHSIIIMCMYFFLTFLLRLCENSFIYKYKYIYNNIMEKYYFVKSYIVYINIIIMILTIHNNILYNVYFMSLY